jgi:hypothetical protein
MALPVINDGESGLIVRNKINSIGAETIRLKSAFPYKPAGEAYLQFNTGQSNGPGGFGLADPLPVVSGIYVWGYTTTAWDSPRDWVLWDPTRDYITGYNSLATTGVDGRDGVFVGSFFGNTASVGYGLAVRMKELTGEDQYIFAVHRPGANSSDWAFGGPCYSVIRDEWLAAKAALALIPNTPELADIEIYMQGSSNAAAGDPAGDFAADYVTFQQDCDLVFELTDYHKTRRFIGDTPTYADPYDWDGMRIASRWGGANTSLFQANDLPKVDAIHLKGESTYYIGYERVWGMVIAGQQPKSQDIGFRQIRERTTAPMAFLKKADGSAAPVATEYIYDPAALTVKFNFFVYPFTFALSLALRSLNSGVSYRGVQRTDATKSITFVLGSNISQNNVDAYYEFGLYAAPVLGAGGAPDAGAIVDFEVVSLPVINKMNPTADSMYLRTDERVAMSRLSDTALNVQTNVALNQVGDQQLIMENTRAIGEIIRGPVIHTQHVVTAPDDLPVLVFNVGVPTSTAWAYRAELSIISPDRLPTPLAGGATLRGTFVHTASAGTGYGENAAVYGTSGVFTTPAIVESAGGLTCIAGGIASEPSEITVDLYMWQIDL